MKVKVIEVFRDKYTDQVYKLNDVLEVDENRRKEIEVYVQDIVENKKTQKKETKDSKK